MLWFRKKPKNRRLGREYVLDVKLRSSQIRAARVRMAAVALGVVFATVFGIFLLWRAGEFALNRLVYENEAFAIRQIDIQTDGVLSVEQIRRWAGVKPGDNLLALDLARVKRDLELISVVQSVSVERILPRTLSLKVVEREPVAEVNVARPRSGGGVELAVFHLDTEGYVMLPLDPRQRSAPANPAAEQLPVISGINPNDIQAGRRIEAPQVQAALQFLVAFEKSAMAGWVDVRRVDVGSPEVLVVTTGQGSEITLGLENPERQLLRWRSIYDEAQKKGFAISQLDLAVTNNIPARWLEASAVPPATPKQPKVFKVRKKHV